MTRKQLIALFVCNMIPVLVGSTLLPLLPVYAGKLGADDATNGIYLAASFASLAFGTFSIQTAA